MRPNRRAIVRVLAAAAVLVSAQPYERAGAATSTVDAAPGFVRTMVGAVKVTALFDGIITLPVRGFLRGDPHEIAADLASDGLHDPIEASDNAFLIDDGKKVLPMDPARTGLRRRPPSAARAGLHLRFAQVTGGEGELRAERRRSKPRR